MDKPTTSPPARKPVPDLTRTKPASEPVTPPAAPNWTVTPMRAPNPAATPPASTGSIWDTLPPAEEVPGTESNVPIPASLRPVIVGLAEESRRTGMTKVQPAHTEDQAIELTRYLKSCGELLSPPGTVTARLVCRSKDSKQVEDWTQVAATPAERITQLAKYPNGVVYGSRFKTGEKRGKPGVRGPRAKKETPAPVVNPTNPAEPDTSKDPNKE